MKTTQRGFIVPLLLIIAAIFLAGGGAYVFLQGGNSSGSDQTLPSNTNPMYGFSSYEDYISNRSEYQAKVDDAFVADVLKNTQDTAQQSNYAVRKGFEYLRDNDPETAIKRLNQGWLIDHNNQNVYWGFAIYTKGNEPALKYFDVALEKFSQKYIVEVNDRDRLVCDAAMGYASAYTDGGRTNSSYLKKAKELASSINIQNATPQCLALINDLKTKNL